MHNFFVNNNQIENNTVRIYNQDAKHISTVLRMKKDEKIYVSNKDTGIKYLSKIEQISKDEVLCTIINEVASTESCISVTLFQGLPKADKMEYIIQKSVELGVYEIVPVEMKNCIYKLKDENKKLQRWQVIAETAAKQSKRNVIPRVSKLENIDSLCNKIDKYDLVIIAYESEENITLKQVLKSSKEAKNIAIIIGPEGGLDKKEIDKLVDSGAKVSSLGKRILRTETAPVAMLSMIMYEYEF